MAGMTLLLAAAMAALMLGIGIPLLRNAVRLYREAHNEPAILRWFFTLVWGGFGFAATIMGVFQTIVVIALLLRGQR